MRLPNDFTNQPCPFTNQQGTFTNQPCWFVKWGLVLICLAATGAGANDTSTADYVLPQIGQRGKTVTCWVRGSRLQTAEEILFYQPGIECTAIRQVSEIPNEQTGNAMPIEPGVGIQLDFKIAPNARLGEYYFRIRTRKKLSEMLSFWVTPYPVVLEKNAYRDTEQARNNTPEFAQEIPLNVTVVGMGTSDAEANDRDFYRVKLEKNQRCTCQIVNARLGTVHYGSRTDMAVEVTSPSGKRVARASRSALFSHDPVVSFFAPEAGEYFIEVRQQMDTEMQNIHYGLHVGDFVRPAVTYPLGGQLGESLELTVFQTDGQQNRLNVVLPKTVGPFDQSMIEITPKIAPEFPEIPSPNRLQVAAFPNVLEDEKSNSPETAQSIGQPLPVALNGIIKTEGERDWFRFSAKKGERYRVRAYAMTLGSSLDPFVWIRPADGNPSKRLYEEDDSLWDGHDWEGHHYRHQVKDRLDPIFMFEPDEDGDYLLGVGDTRRESGEDYVYRVEIQPHRDSVFAFYQDYPSQATIVRDVVGIHRGSTQTRPLAIQNGFGSRYDGPIRLEARGLPSFVQFEAPIFTKNDPVILTTFSVPKDAEFQACTFELVPHAVDENVDLLGSLAQTHASNDWRGGYAPMFNKTRKLAFAVLEEAPFEVSIEQPKIGLAKNAELDLKVNVKRKGDFKEALYLEMDWLPAGVTRQPPLIIAAGEDVGNYKLSATAQAKPGTYRLSITTRQYEGGNPRTGVGYHYIASDPISIEVLDPYFEITLERAAIEQGKTGELVGKIKHLRKFEGEATAKLLRLPTGVTLVEQPKIKPGDETVVFKIKVAEDALTGQSKQIACDVAISEKGQTIHQQTGDGTLRIDEARGKEGGVGE